MPYCAGHELCGGCAESRRLDSYLSRGKSQPDKCRHPFQMGSVQKQERVGCCRRVDMVSLFIPSAFAGVGRLIADAQQTPLVVPIHIKGWSPAELLCAHHWLHGPFCFPYLKPALGLETVKKLKDPRIRLGAKVCCGAEALGFGTFSKAIILMALHHVIRLSSFLPQALGSAG